MGGKISLDRFGTIRKNSGRSTDLDACASRDYPKTLGTAAHEELHPEAQCPDQETCRHYHAVRIFSARITLVRTDIPALLRAFNNLGPSLLELFTNLFTNLFHSRNNLIFLVA